MKEKEISDAELWRLRQAKVLLESVGVEIAQSEDLENEGVRLTDKSNEKER